MRLWSQPVNRRSRTYLRLMTPQCRPNLKTMRAACLSCSGRRAADDQRGFSGDDERCGSHVLAGCSEARSGFRHAGLDAELDRRLRAHGNVLYANTFISQYDGANRRSDDGIAVAGDSTCDHLGLLLLICLPISRPLLSMMGHPADVAEYEAQYFNTLCAGSPITLLATALSCYFNGRRMTHVAMF